MTNFHQLKSYSLFTLMLIMIFSLNAQIQIGDDIVPNFAGNSISMPDRNTIAVGRSDNTMDSISGRVRIYTLKNNIWTQKGLDIEGNEAGDGFGELIFMPDDVTIAIGAYKNDANGIDAGQVKIFKWINNKWTQKGDNILGENAGDGFGYSLFMPDENTIAIGAPFYSKNGITGRVRIFSLINNKWTQKGNNIDGENEWDWSGTTVCMPNSFTIAIGSNQFGPSKYGIVRVFKFEGNSWGQKGQLIVGEAEGMSLGHSLSMPDENTIGIGAPGFIATKGSLVRVYKWNGVDWIQKGADFFGRNLNDSDGTGFNINMPDANTIAFGSYNYDIKNPIYKGNGVGRVKIYKWTGNSWVQKGVDIEGDIGGDMFGYSISMPDNSTIAIGAIGAGVNSYIRVFDLSSLDVPKFDTNNTITYYPNPALNEINVKVSDGQIGNTYLIFDNCGELVLSGKLVSEITHINLGGLTAGLYLFKIREDEFHTFKVIKK